MVRPTRPTALERVGTVLCAGLLALSACSTTDDQPVAITRDDVIVAYGGQGLDDEVSACVVGLGEREFELDDLMPDAEVDELTRALIDEVVASCREAAAILDADPGEPETLAFDIGPFTYGDDARLDYLWEQCEAGDGRACDRLWTDAPIDSEYEEFGVTCGNRLDLLDCTEELVLEDDEADPAE